MYKRILILMLFIMATTSTGFAAVHIVNGIIQTDGSVQTGADTKTLEVAGDIATYTDYPLGYRISFPQHMNVDVSLSTVRTVLFDDKTKIEIYYDNLNNTEASADDYIQYSRSFLNNTKDHQVSRDETFRQNGLKVRLLKWSRRPLARLAVDRRYYATAEIIKNDREVYTISIKSTEPINNEKALINSFRLVEQRGKTGIYLPLGPTKTALNQETAQFFATYFAESSPLRWGIFEHGATDNMEKLETIEREVDFQFPFLVKYQQLGEEAPLLELNRAYQNRKYVELTLQTFFYDKDNAGVMYDILDGKYDEYFRQYAADLKKLAHPVLFRFNNEMNGDWCWYSALHTARDTDITKAVWHHLHSLFDQVGVDNVLWVWNPHDRSFPDFAWNHYLAYYPGDDVVDVVGMTGYNTGNYYPGETWREFKAIYTPLYREYSSIFNKPLMITEFGANSVGGNKPAWITQMFQDMKQFNQIKVAIWWNGIDWDSKGRPARIYRLDENESVVAAMREGLRDYREQ